MPMSNTIDRNSMFGKVFLLCTFFPHIIAAEPKSYTELWSLLLHLIKKGSKQISSYSFTSKHSHSHSVYNNKERVSQILHTTLKLQPLTDTAFCGYLLICVILAVVTNASNLLPPYFTAANLAFISNPLAWPVGNLASENTYNIQQFIY